MPLRGEYRFSDHFRLKASQSQLDFVDIPLDTDISLYIDPYALSVSGDDWLRTCGDIVVNFFQLLLKTVKEGNRHKGLTLLSHLREPNDTHLGLSLGRPSGRGWGPRQGEMLYETLRASSAVLSGSLRDLCDFELFIPGIGPDKISDLTTNLIRGQLATYTEGQCRLYSIPTERINSGIYWDPYDHIWTSRYADLPVYRNERIVLIPKTAVRVRLIPDYEEFYDRFVLDFLEAEHLNANDSLVTLLRNGNPKIFKGDLKERYPLSKDFLFEFVQNHPEVLREYKDFLPQKDRPLAAAEIEGKQVSPRMLDHAALIEELNGLPCGPNYASKYQNFIVKAATELFYPMLDRPTKEQMIDEGRKRIDIYFNNAAERGFFSRLVNAHHIHAPYVAIECKNYFDDIGNPEIDQLSSRFSRKRGRFGILFCRNTKDQTRLLKRLQDVVNNATEPSVVIVLEDEDVKVLLKLKSAADLRGIDTYLEEKLRAILL